MQAGLDAHPGVAGLDPFLVSVLMEQARAVEIQAVALLAGLDPLDAPLPERAEAALVLSAESNTALPACGLSLRSVKPISMDSEPVSSIIAGSTVG